MRSSRRQELIVLIISIAVIIAAVASLLIQFHWRDAPWSGYARTGLLAFCVSAVVLSYRLGDPVTPALTRVLSPNWRRVAIGAAVVFCTFPWTLIVALGIRYGILRDDVATGMVLLVPDAVLLVAGLYILIRGLFGASRSAA